MKRKVLRRMVPLLLAASLLFGQAPYALAAPVGTETTALDGEPLTLPEDAEGTFLAFAANAVADDTPIAMWELEERGFYSVTIYRAGDLSGETTAELRTIDVSAAYGKDYRLLDAGGRTEELETGGTLMEQHSGDPEAKAQGKETMEEISAQAASAEASGEEAGAETAGEAGTAEAADSEAAADAVTGGDSKDAGDGKSELARLKEAQTGQPSRETCDTELLPMNQDLISYLIPDLGAAVEASSTTTLTFAPGESEKTIVFEILEDTTSEGTESFNLILSNAEGGAVFLPGTMGVSIKDDEPIEHSLVTFSAPSYSAEKNKVTVKVERSGAEYALVTARVLSIATGSAAEGVNYAQVDQELAFEPFVTEATLDIPVKAEPGKETSFELRLTDLKGGEEGERVTAAVTIPAGPKGTTPAKEDGEAATLMADGTVTIPDFGVENYELRDAGNDTYKILDVTKNPAQEVGIYVKPTDANGSVSHQGDSGCGTNRWENDHRKMRWYSKCTWKKGGETYTYTLQDYQLYQQVYLDYSAGSGYNNSKTGYSFNVWGPTNVIYGRNFQTGGKLSRQVRGAQLLYADALDKVDGNLQEYHSNKLVPSCWKEKDENWITVSSYIKKTASALTEPSMDLYGIVAMYRQYRVSVEQPAEMKYIDIDSLGNATVVNRRPATVFLAQGHNVRYPFQQIAITDTALNTGEPIGGTLKGYYIRPLGTEGDGYFYATTSNIIDLNRSMMQELDEYARDHWNKTESIMKKGAGNVYYMDLSIRPVYEKTYVTVKVTPNEEGKFNWGCLDPNNQAEIDRIAKADGRISTKTVVVPHTEVKYVGGFRGYQTVVKYETVSKTFNNVSVDRSNGTISGLFAVGDRLNLDATPADDGFTYTSCHYEGFKNPGDTVAMVNQELNQHSQMVDWKRFTVTCSRTELKPQFTNDGNRIEVNFENGAEDYFYLTQLATAKQKNGKFPDKRVLYIEDSLSGDNVTPVLGHGYTLKAVPAPGNDGTIRPVFTLADGTQVNGWAVDLIAKYKAGQNRITVGWEKYDPKQETYYSLEGLARYGTVTVRQSSQGLKDEPARDVMITAGGEAVGYYTKNQVLGQTVIRRTASTDGEGHFVLDGVKAIAGDRISLLITDNGATQVEYRFIPEEGRTENRTFTEIQANPTTRTNETVKRTEQMKVVDLTADPTDADGAPEPLEMPVITGYTPYVTDVRFMLADHPADGRNNTVPIYAGDYVTLEADVSIPKLGERDAELKEVQFVIYDKDGELKDTYSTTRKQSAEGKDLNTWQILVPYTPPESWPYQPIKDGDQVFVRVLGPDRTMVRQTVDADGVTTEETVTVETPYALLNTGLSFFTPVVDVVEQSYISELPEPPGVDLMGKLSSKVNTGTMSWGKEYDDPNNTATSNYIQYFGIDLAAQHNKTSGFSKDANGVHVKQWDRMKELMAGKEKAAEKSFENQLLAYQAQGPNGAPSQEMQDRARYNDRVDQRVQNGEISQERGDQLKANYAAGQPDMFTDGLKKDALNKFGGPQIGIELKVVHATQWIYDAETNSHIQWGSAWSFTAAGKYSQTFYTIVASFPVYLNIEVMAIYDYESGADSSERKIRAQDYARQENLQEYDCDDYAWHTLGVNGKLSVGVGIYGIVGARGIVKLGFTGMWTYGPWNPNGGVLVTMGGGVAFDLFLLSITIEFSGPSWGTGAFSTKPVREGEKLEGGGEASLQGAGSAPRLSLKAFDPGEETYNAILEDGADLQSVLVPKQEETIIDGAVQYVRPQVVGLDEDTFLFFFLENRAGEGSRTQANASALVYAVADVTEDNRILWDHEMGTVVVDDDGLMDTNPSVLRMGDSVYVAWATGDAAGVETVEGAKQALSSTNIKLQKLKVNGETVEKSGSPVLVTDDAFQNTNPMLVEEKGNLAVYYFKQDLSRVETTEDLLNLTGNYNTYARRLYDADLTPQPQITYGGIPLAADRELYVNLPGDAMTADLTVLDYTDAEGTVYRLAAYSADGDGSIETGNDQQVWLQVQNLTDDKAWYPVMLDEGEAGNIQLNKVNLKTRAYDGEGKYHDEVTRDVFLTWVNGTCLNTLSFNELFRGLRDEPGTWAALKGLTDEEAASPEWVNLAYERAGGREDQQITLRSLAQGDPIFASRDFGSYVDLGDGESGKQGSTLSKYTVITGEDGNTYLAWTKANCSGSNVGNELWMSSYYVFNDSLREDYDQELEMWEEYDRQIANAGENAEAPPKPSNYRLEPIPYEGWSDPVQVTDFTLTMSETDRARYKELLGLEANAENSAELYALNAKYSRGIDEVSAVVSKDSGAMFLANTFRQTDENGFIQRDYKLSAIRCVPDTSLEIENLTVSNPNPEPDEVVLVSWDVVNTGLLPATDYRMNSHAVNDSGEVIPGIDWTRNQPLDTIYPGARKHFVFEWHVSDYHDSEKLTMEVTEQNPAAGASDLETTNSQTVTLTRSEELLLGQPYGRPAIGYAEKALLNPTDSADFYQDDAVAQEADAEYQALLTQHGDAAGLLDAYSNTVDTEGSEEAHRYLYVFVPAYNNSGEAMTDLTFTVSKSDSERVMGETKVDYLDKKETRLIPILVPVRTSEFIDLGVLLANVKVTDAEGKELDSTFATIQLRDNTSLEITATGGNADRLQSVEGVSPAQLRYQAAEGDGVVGSETWKSLASGNPDVKAKRIDLKVGETIQLTSVEAPFNSKNKAWFADYSYLLGSDTEASLQSAVAVTGNGMLTGVAPGTALICAVDKGTDAAVVENFAKSVNQNAGQGIAADLAGTRLTDEVAIFVTGAEGSTHTVSVSDATGGTAETSAASAAAGSTVTVTLSPEAGYTAAGITLTDADGNSIAVTDQGDGTYSFTMPDSAVTVTPQFTRQSGSGGGGSSLVAHEVTLPDTVTGGSAEVSSKEAVRGRTVTITVKPDEGYQTVGVTVTDSRGNEISVTDEGNGVYRFTMPDSAVTVTPAFRIIGADSSMCPKDNTCPISRFTDADPKAWYHDGVHWALENGVMIGVDNNLFAPDSSATRAMVVTMLWRLEGEKGGKPSAFTDVAPGIWYEKAVNWAVENGVVLGTSETTFSPDTPITREQLATILYRYAKMKGQGFTDAWAFPLDFSDGADVSAWANEAIHWMTMKQVIQGMDGGKLAPQSDATRAQIATIFMRFCALPED